MKKILKNLNIDAYEFEDLSPEAQERAIEDHINFWLEVVSYDEAEGNYKKALDEARSMQTPWFVGNYVYDYCKKDVINEIKINNYLFDVEGNLLPVTYHTKGNKVVKTTMRIAGQELEVELI